MELQLAIFEYAVIENEPLLLNCGCDSSYKTIEAWHEDQALWERGEKQPPVQPGLARTCHLVRAIVLPMYYQHNTFRAHYCYQAELSVAIRWLKSIGHANRVFMTDLTLLDMNPGFDWQVPSNLRKAGRSEIVRTMGGRLEAVERSDCCCHRVVFGDVDEDYLDSLSHLFGDDPGQ